MVKIPSGFYVFNFYVFAFGGRRWIAIDGRQHYVVQFRCFDPALAVVMHETAVQGWTLTSEADLTLLGESEIDGLEVVQTKRHADGVGDREEVVR